MYSAVQNGHFLRFLIVLGAVVFTIFIYASYYSSRSLSIPHIRTGTSLALTKTSEGSIRNIYLNETPEKLENNIVSSRNNMVNTKTQKLDNTKHQNIQNIVSKTVKHHRKPTIDVDLKENEDADVDVLLEDAEIRDGKYQKIISINIGENSTTIQPLKKIDNNIYKISDSDVLIPTLNLQKFMENDEKSVGLLITSRTNGKDYADSKKTSTVMAPFNNITNELFPNHDDNLKNISPNQTNIVKNTNINARVVDPSQEILTKQIYETGHLDDQININEMCPLDGDGIKLLILITSAISHIEARLAIRQTWGHYSKRRDVSTLFILGRTTNDTLNAALTQENFLYGDLIRGHFMDSYNNLTLKTLSSFEWVDRHCARAKFILKTDDDMFINVPKLLSFLDKHAKEKRVIYGRLAKKWKPIRNEKSKYYVSSGQFSATVFPPFTTGPAYVLTSDVIHDLFQSALQQTYLKLEDVFTTGIVAQKLGIKRVHVNEFLNRRIAFNPCNIRKTISVHMIKSNEQFDLWKKLLDQTTKCK